LSALRLAHIIVSTGSPQHDQMPARQAGQLLIPYTRVYLQVASCHIGLQISRITLANDLPLAIRVNDQSAPDWINDGFFLGKLLQPVRPKLSAYAGALVTTNGGIGHGAATSVDIDAAGPDTLGHLVRRCGVGAHDAAVKAVARIVGDGNSFVVSVEADHNPDGPKDFFLGDGHIIAYVVEQRQFDEIPFIQPGRTATATYQSGALLQAAGDKLLNFGALRFAD